MSRLSGEETRDNCEREREERKRSNVDTLIFFLSFHLIGIASSARCQFCEVPI